MAARPGDGRLELDQRHALCARRAGRFRRLGADGRPRLELRRRAALLQKVRALCAGRRPRGARPGRSPQGRGLPHHPAAHPPLRRSRPAGGLPLQSRPQRQAAQRRRLFADDAARPLSRLDGADLPARGQAPAEPPGRDRGAGRQAPVRGQALRRCVVPAWRQPHRGARQPRSDRLGRNDQLAAHPARLGYRPGRAPAVARHSRGARPAGRGGEPDRPLCHPRRASRARHADRERDRPLPARAARDRPLRPHRQGRPHLRRHNGAALLRQPRGAGLARPAAPVHAGQHESAEVRPARRASPA